MTAWLVVVILGVIEGITEFLPISSTGHMLIAEQWLPYRQSDTFLVVIQSGAVVAVLLVFKDRVLRLLKGWREAEPRAYLLKLAGAFTITAAGGLVLKKAGFALPETAAPVGAALLIGGVLFLVVERWLRGRTSSDEVTWSMAAAMGVAQLVAAVFPGTSRSGACILIALMMGLGRSGAIEFSFLLGVPTLLAAGAVKLLSWMRHPGSEALVPGMLVLGIVVSLVTAFVAVRWLLGYMKSHTFVGFGWYRIVAGSAVLLMALL